MKNIKFLFTLLVLFALENLNAQTGLNFQGVARTSNNVLLASQDITLKLSIVQGSATGIPEYIEIRKVKTNAQGLFTAVIGDTGTISTLGNFSELDWKLSPKFLKIEIDPAAGNNFITMGTTQFQYVAYAKFANSVPAENILGVVPVARGGTGASSLASLKTTLSIDKVNNTADSLKPISKLIQTALELKLNAADTSKYTKIVYSDSVWANKLNIADSASGYITPSKLASYNFSKGNGGASIDTTSLSNRIDLKASNIDLTNLTSTVGAKLNTTDTSYLLKKSDTASWLRKTDTSTLSNRIDLKLNIRDTVSWLKKTDTSTLSNRINLKLNTTDTSSLLRKSQVGANNGAASLDATGKVPSVQIPAISFSSVDVVNSMAAMLSFTSGTGLPTDRLIGSIVVRLDSSKNFVLAQLPASNRANWVELVNPDAPVKTVNGLYGYVDLRKANIVDLINVDNTSDEAKPLSFAARTALDLKLNITDTSSLLKKADTSFLLQKVDTAAILAMYAKKFTKDVVVNYGGGSLGKYANGTTIPAKGKTLDDFLLDLVSKSVAPGFSAPSVSIGASPGAGSYEIGYDPGLVSLSSTYTKNDGGNASSTIFYKGGTALSANTNSPGPITTTVSYSVTVNYAAGTATKNDNLGTPYPNTITAGSTSASLSFSSYSKRYWGGISTPFGSTADIRTLTTAPSSDNAGSTQTFTGNLMPTGTQNVFFAYLATSPDLTSILYNGLEQIDSYTKSIVTITNAQGYSQNYKVYTSKETYSSTLNGVSFR